MTQLPVWAQELLDTEPVGHLGVLDADGYPRVLPVTFARVGEAFWTAVDHKPKRVAADRLARLRWLDANPRCSLTIDRYDNDWSRLAWVQFLCTATIIERSGQAVVLDALARRYVQYRDRMPAGPLVRLEPLRAVCWCAASTPPDRATPRPRGGQPDR